MTSNPNGDPTEPGSGSVVISGATRGIGRQLAVGLAALGHQVVVLGRNQHRVADVVSQITAAGHQACGAVADVADYAAVHAAVAQILHNGPIAALVNCAGVIEATPAPVWELAPEEVKTILNTNVLGAFHLVRTVVPEMIAAGGGRVVDLNSGFGVRSAPDYPAYQMSKSALFRLGGSLALAGAKYGVFAFELAPGVVQTDMTRSMPVWDNFTGWTEPQAVVELTHGLVTGQLDQWSGRMVRAGVDTIESLQAACAHRDPLARELRLVPYSDTDPLAPKP